MQGYYLVALCTTMRLMLPDHNGVCVVLQWAWYLACFTALAAGAIMFGGFALYARKRRILWIPIPAQDANHRLRPDSQKHMHDLHLPLLAGVISHR